MVLQELWEWPTNDWSNWRPELGQGANVQCCLDSQIAQDMAAPETYCRNNNHWSTTTTTTTTTITTTDDNN